MPKLRKAAAATAAPATALIEHLRDGSARTRSELVTITGFSRSAVTARLDQLISNQLVVALGDAESTGGRPSSQYALNRTARLLLCVDLGATHVTVAVADLAGAILDERTEPVDVASDPDDVFSRVTAIADRLLDGQGRSTTALLGVGIGVPGPVEHATGRLVNPPIMPAWHDYDVRARIQQYADIPVLVDNDVNIMALGERAAHHPAVDDLIFVKVGTGLGGGIVSGGRLQRGYRGVAGDLGHIRINRTSDIACRCGSTRCVARFATGKSIAAEMARRGLPTVSPGDVVEAVHSADPIALDIIRQAGRDIGEMLLACISVTNPAVIVIGGSVALAGEPLLAGVREIVYGQATPLATGGLQIIESRAGARAGVLGAAALASEHLLAPEQLERMLAS